jgi:hypothetical protein
VKVKQVGFEVLTAVSTKMAVFWVDGCLPGCSANFYQTTRRYNPEDSHLRNLNGLQKYDIAQNCRILHRVVQRLSRHNLKILHHRHI